jgi:hypothetical protein
MKQALIIVIITACVALYAAHVIVNTPAYQALVSIGGHRG